MSDEDRAINPYESPQAIDRSAGDPRSIGEGTIELKSLLVETWRTLIANPWAVFLSMVSQGIVLTAIGFVFNFTNRPVYQVMEALGIENQFVIFLGVPAFLLFIFAWGYAGVVRTSLSILSDRPVGFFSVFQFDLDVVQTLLVWLPHYVVLLGAALAIGFVQVFRETDWGFYLEILAAILVLALQCIFSLAPFFIVERRWWFPEAMFASARCTLPYLTTLAAGYALAFVATALLAAISLGIGGLLLFPAFGIMTGVAYRHLTGQAAKEDVTAPVENVSGP